MPTNKKMKGRDLKLAPPGKHNASLQHRSLWLRFYKQISGELNRQMCIVS